MAETQLDWRNPPNITAPSPDKGGAEIYLEVSNDILSPARNNFRKTPLFQVWTHLLGCPPPIPNVSILEHDDLQPTYQTLHDASSCFKGIKRPINNQENGAEVITYVLNPENTVECVPRMGASIRAQKTAPRYLLTVQIVLNGSLQLEGKDIEGRVTRIEIVKVDSVNDRLPIGHENRYGSRLW